MNSTSKQEQYLLKQMQRIYDVAPASIGNSFITNIYKHVTHHLKQMPFVVLLPIALAVSITVYLIFGWVSIVLVSFLQYGF